MRASYAAAPPKFWPMISELVLGFSLQARRPASEKFTHY